MTKLVEFPKHIREEALNLLRLEREDGKGITEACITVSEILDDPPGTGPKPATVGIWARSANMKFDRKTSRSQDEEAAALGAVRTLIDEGQSKNSAFRMVAEKFDVAPSTIRYWWNKRHPTSPQGAEKYRGSSAEETVLRLLQEAKEIGYPAAQATRWASQRCGLGPSVLMDIATEKGIFESQLNRYSDAFRARTLATLTSRMKLEGRSLSSVANEMADEEFMPSTAAIVRWYNEAAEEEAEVIEYVDVDQIREEARKPLQEEVDRLSRQLRALQKAGAPNSELIRENKALQASVDQLTEENKNLRGDNDYLRGQIRKPSDGDPEEIERLRTEIDHLKALLKHYM